MFDDAAAHVGALHEFFGEVSDGHFILGVVTEDADVDLVGQPFPIEKVIALYELPQGVEAFVQFVPFAHQCFPIADS